MSPPHDIATPFEAVAPAPVAAPTSTAAADATVAAHPLKAKAQAVSNNKDDGLIAEPASPAGILAVLSRTSPFSTLNPEHLVKVASLVQPVKLGKGTQVYEEGSSQSAMIIVVQGTLQVVKNGKLAGQLSPYDSIGFRNLFGDAPAPATLIASEAASCFTLSIERKDFAPLLAREPTLALALLPALAAHMPDAAAVATHTNTVALESATSAAIAATIEAGLPRERSKFVVRVFDAKAYQTAAFLEQNARPEFGFALEFLEEKLTAATVEQARGAHAVCVFVHDSVDAAVAQALVGMGIEMVAYRCAGFDTCNVAAADAAGLSVARVPSYSPNAIAEHAAGLILCLNRKLIWASARVHTGDFSLDGLVGFDLKGKTAGVVGTGKIGACLVSILLGFGCRVLCHDVYKNPALLANPAVQYVEMGELLAQSDIISLHAPLMPETHHLVNASTIAQMKRGVMLINTSRGPLVDTRALIDALKSGQVGSCGLDVVEGENDYFYENRSDLPVTDDGIAHLLSFANRVIVTAHQAFLTHEALREIAATTLRNIADFHQGKRLKQLANSVNNVLPPSMSRSASFAIKNE